MENEYKFMTENYIRYSSLGVQLGYRKNNIRKKQKDFLETYRLNELKKGNEIIKSIEDTIKRFHKENSIFEKRNDGSSIVLEDLEFWEGTDLDGYIFYGNDPTDISDLILDSSPLINDISTTTKMLNQLLKNAREELRQEILNSDEYHLLVNKYKLYTLEGIE